MSLENEARSSIVWLGIISAVVVAAWSVYAAIGGLEPNGRRFLELGGIRVVLFAALLAFGFSVRGRAGHLLTAGLIVAGTGVAAYIVGGIGAVAIDGWSFNPMDDAGAEPPWYLIVLGLSANVFSLGAILVGIAGRSAGWLSGTVLLGGLLYPLLLFPLQPFGVTAGHILWLLPWLALGIGLAARARRLLPSG